MCFLWVPVLEEKRRPQGSPLSNRGHNPYRVSAHETKSQTCCPDIPAFLLHQESQETQKGRCHGLRNPSRLSPGFLRIKYPGSPCRPQKGSAKREESRAQLLRAAR